MDFLNPELLRPESLRSFLDRAVVSWSGIINPNIRRV